MQSEFSVQKEAVWVVTNMAANGTKQQIDYCINKGIITHLCAILSIADIEIILAILESFHFMLKTFSPDVETLTDLIEECGGIFYFLSFFV